MGCCCQLEIKKCSQVEIEFFSPRIQTFKPYNTVFNSMKQPIDFQNKANYETNTPRTLTNEELIQFNILEKVIKDYRKSITETKIKNILFPKRLETIKETNSEVSIKKSSTIEQMAIRTSTLQLKGKNGIEEAEKSAFDSDKEKEHNYSYHRTGDIKKLLVLEDNAIEESAIKIHNSYYLTNLTDLNESITQLHSNFNKINYNESGFNISTNSNNSNANCILLGNKSEIDTRDKIIQQFKLISEDSNNNTSNDNHFIVQNKNNHCHRLLSYQDNFNLPQDCFNSKYIMK